MIRRCLTMIAALALGAAPALAQQPETPLDAAVADGMRDPALRGAFYELFLDTRLYVAFEPEPRHVDPSRVRGELRAGAADDRVAVAFIASEFEGLPLINLFDTIERLEAFAASRNRSGYGILHLPGSEILDSFQGDVFLLLNPETPFQKFFGPEEVQWLRDGVQAAVTPQLHLMRREVFRGLVIIAEPSPALVSAIAATLVSRPDITAAWLLEPADREADPAGMSLILISDRPASTELINALGVAMQGLIGAGRFLDMAVMTEADAAQFLPADGAPVWRRD